MGIETTDMGQNRAEERKGRGFLMSLLRDTRGNAMIIMAAALIPLAGMVGGGVDLARMYIVKTRLQHACDAGALAGRRTMGAGTWSYNNFAARGKAVEFFNANIGADPYGSSDLTSSFSESDGKVRGTASAMVPMTLMRIFDAPTQKIEVTCDAELSFPNTDVMFVLDNTGSMDQRLAGEVKMVALKKAVKCFYEALAKIDTTAVCSKPVSGTVDPSVQMRFGFVPYSVNVNVGRILPPGFFANKWSYDTREFVNNAGGSTHWDYGFLEKNIAPLTTGSPNWPRTMTAKVGSGGTNKTISWDGCIEEAKTDPDPLTNPSLAKDLNIDLVPNGADPETLLGPMLPELIYRRNDGWGNRTKNPVNSTTQDWNTEVRPQDYFCPATSVKLQKWPTAAPFEKYVDDLVAVGNTYHDIGLLWGGRLISPDGMFASENKTTASGAPIARHVIFMTDGETVTLNSNYSAYGIPWYDERNVKPAGNWGASFNDKVNMRFLALCQQIKDKNITLWVVAFGNVGSAVSNLKTCSSPGHFYSAGSSTDLEDVFGTIAGKIAELRITQ